MIEGSQIDWGGHANKTSYMVTELLDFDQVIGEVLDYAEADGNTLVIVTATMRPEDLQLKERIFLAIQQLPVTQQADIHQ